MATNSLLARKFSLVAGAFVAILFVTFFVLPQAAHAGVGTGGTSTGGGAARPGGPRGGLNGCPYTTNGQGWFEIPVNAGNAPTGNGYWSVANSTCAGEGATHVIAYVVFTGERNLERGWIYRFIWGWENGGPYIGNLDVGTAQARFNMLPDGDRAGFTFGSNLGWFCYNSRTPYSINAQSYIAKSNFGGYVQSDIVATPGERLQFAHNLRANGRIGDTVFYTIRGSGFPDDFRAMGQPWSGPTTIMHGNVSPPIANGDLFVRFDARGGGNGSYMTYDVRQDDVGNTLCQAIEYAPTTDTNGGASSSTRRCAAVPYNYTLTPILTNVTDGSVVESTDEPLNVTGLIRNDGPTKSRTNVVWELTQIEYDMPLTSIPNRTGGVNVPGNPCAYFTGEEDCNTLISTPVPGGIGFPGSIPASAIASLADKPTGTKICFSLSVRPSNATTNNWTHSALQCLIVGKKPKVQVLSGDLFVGRGSATVDARESDVNTSTSRNVGRFYGSWAEYGIVASGCVSGMASAAGYAGGTATSLYSGLSLLTFTNLASGECPDNYGKYAHVTAASSIATRFPINTPAGGPGAADPTVLPGASVVLTGLTDPEGVYQAPAGATSIEIKGGADIPAGRLIVINAPGATVRITGDIRYTTDPLTSLASIPQVVIIANNIIVADSVSQIGAWLIASGTGANGVVNTCGEGGGGVTTTSALTTDVCGTQLVVNGPVIANHLVLRRTGGSEPDDRGRPAEVFNLRPDSYLWATGYNISTGRLSTVSTKELPPRF